MAHPNRIGWGLLFAAVGIGTVLRVLLAWTDHGIYWPDEIFQSFEPAHRLVFGYGLVPWEFVDGARNWALPGAVAGILQVLASLGMDHPAQYIPWTKTVFALFASATIWGVWRLARGLGSSDLSAGAGAMAFALIAPAIYFAPRAMSETLSTFFVVLGLSLALPSATGRAALIGGSSLLGIATLLRLQNGVFCAGLLIVLLIRRAWRDAAIAGVTLLCWAAIFGLLDKLTWGQWFHSAEVYLRFNLVEGRASGWGTSHWIYYLWTFFKAMPAASVVLAILAGLAVRRAPALFALFAVFLVLHSLVPHKELRFVFAALPLWCALAAVGADAVPVRATFATIGVLLLTTAYSGVRHRSLKMTEVGQYVRQRPESPAFDDFGDLNRLLLRAHDLPDLCGLRIDAAHLAWTGGHTYLHKKVPIYPGHVPAETRYFNYVLVPSQPIRSGEIVAAEGGVMLVRLPWSCTPDRGYSWRLP